MGLINMLNDIGNAVREKSATKELIPLIDMAEAIRNIEDGVIVEELPRAEGVRF